MYCLVCGRPIRRQFQLNDLLVWRPLYEPALCATCYQKDIYQTYLQAYMEEGAYEHLPILVAFIQQSGAFKHGVDYQTRAYKTRLYDNVGTLLQEAGYRVQSLSSCTIPLRPYRSPRFGSKKTQKVSYLPDRKGSLSLQNLPLDQSQERHKT